MIQTAITPFETKLGSKLKKQPISVLQINLGKRCNLACTHCHVEAGPNRTEELSEEICQQLIQLINRFDQIKTIDLTGGAPEMNYGFKPLVEAARSQNKEVIVRSNLTIYFVAGYQDIPEYCAKNKARIVASLPCYLEDNVDKMRGKGVYQDSIEAIKILNQLGYGRDPGLILDFVYNPPIPNSDNFSLPPQQQGLEQAYKSYLKKQFDLEFNQLLTITNLPIGRTKFQLNHRHLHQSYLQFLEESYNPTTVEHLMCRNELSIDYLGKVYDCDFNQMENIPARLPNGEALTVNKLLEMNDLDVIQNIKTAAYCYGCTAGSGSSCGGSLV
ncbi:MAG: arsenosugar biosynthesis radical SAM (seleno)protein ArsS [Microcoleaceae cyanobacterium]